MAIVTPEDHSLLRQLAFLMIMCEFIDSFEWREDKRGVKQRNVRCLGGEGKYRTAPFTNKDGTLEKQKLIKLQASMEEIMVHFVRKQYIGNK